MHSQSITVIQPSGNPERAISDDGLVKWSELQESPIGGMRFNVGVIISLDGDNRPYLRAIDTIYRGACFIPRGLTHEDEALLSKYCGMPIVVELMLSEILDNPADHGCRYEVMPWITLAPFSLYKTRAELKQFAPEDRGVIEGNFVGCRQLPDNEFVWELTTPDGPVEIISYRPAHFNHGVLENLQDEPPLIGETVQVCVNRDESGIYVLFSTECDWLYLKVPAGERRTSYKQLREIVARHISRFRVFVYTRQYELARLYFASLRRLELTADEQAHIQEVMCTLPRSERAVYHPDNIDAALELEGAYGVSVEAMNAEEFTRFARHVIFGVRTKAQQKGTRELALFDYITSESIPLDPYERGFTLRQSFYLQLERLQECTDEYDDYEQILVPLEDTIEAMSFVNDAMLALDIELLIEHCVDRRYFRGNSEAPKRMSGLLLAAFEAFKNWRSNHATCVQTTQPQIEIWRDRLVADGLDDDALLKKIQEVIALLEVPLE